MLNKLLHSEVNLLIQHVIAEDQDGQNNNTVVTGPIKTRVIFKETDMTLGTWFLAQLFPNSTYNK